MHIEVLLYGFGGECLNGNEEDEARRKTFLFRCCSSGNLIKIADRM